MDIRTLFFSNPSAADIAGAIRWFDSDCTLSRELSALYGVNRLDFDRIHGLVTEALKQDFDALTEFPVGFVLALMVTPSLVPATALTLDRIESLAEREFNDVFGVPGRHNDLLRFFDQRPVQDGTRPLAPKTLVRLDMISFARPVPSLQRIVDRQLDQCLDSLNTLPDDELIYYAMLAHRRGKLTGQIANTVYEKWPTLTEFPLISAPGTRALPKRPRVAICISGQLRGYKQAFQSWEENLLPHIDATFFVHTWNDIGRKQPSPPHIDRCYSGNFLDSVRKVFLRTGWPEFCKLYPLLANLQGGENVTASSIASFYGCPEENVVVENDHGEKFHKYNNPMKMFYKMQAANNLATGKQFDLVVRMRPDKTVDKTVTTEDWDNILRGVYQE